MSFEFIAPKGMVRFSFLQASSQSAIAVLSQAANENSFLRQHFSAREKQEIFKNIHPYLESGMITRAEYKGGDGVSVFIAANDTLRNNMIFHILKRVERGKATQYTIGCPKTGLISNTVNFEDILHNMRNALGKLNARTVKPFSMSPY